MAHHEICKKKSSPEIHKIFASLGIHIRDEKINFLQFQKMMDVANFKAKPEEIIKFVNSYLAFDSIGEMDREEFSGSL